MNKHTSSPLSPSAAVNASNTPGVTFGSSTVHRNSHIHILLFTHVQYTEVGFKITQNMNTLSHVPW